MLAIIWCHQVWGIISPELQLASVCHQEFCAVGQEELLGTVASHLFGLLSLHPKSCSHTGRCCLSVWKHQQKVNVTGMFNSLKHRSPSNNHLHLSIQTLFPVLENHLISDRKVLGQSFTALNHHRIDSIQKLVTKERVLLPVVMDIIWKIIHVSVKILHRFLKLIKLLRSSD